LVRHTKSNLEQGADVRLVDDGRAIHPTTSAEGMQQIMGNFENKASVVETVKDAVRDAGKALKSKL
jgi:multifunctional beta-oxidation protein